MTSTKARRISKATKTKRKKVRNIVAWLKILIVVKKMKWSTLLLRINHIIRMIR